MSRYLLFVDDLAQQRALFGDAIEDWNARNTDLLFETDELSDYEEAVTALSRRRYDGALFDLRLPAGGPDNQDKPLGNNLASIGLHQQGIPVAIISAKPNEVDPELANSSTVKIFNKGDRDVYSKAVEWFGGQWEMMSALAEARKKVRTKSADLFLERIWPSWQSYMAIGQGEDLSPILARQFVWHLGEVMGLGGETGELWHPLESWIVPPLHQGRLATGDLLQQDDQLWMVMSPPCDLANPGKINSVLLLNCVRDLPEGWAAMLEKCRAGDANQQRKSEEKISKLFNQSEQAQHFLSPLPGEVQPVVVRFSHMLTVPADEMENLVPLRLGSVAAPFMSNLIQRFGAYISRVGQPNLDPKAFAEIGATCSV